ncbi:hypothetical protein GKJPGBOP_05758 [Streptomyces paromomycinus]|uniref:Uncharacterized protein n=1 Tax=Streptomyces paromomycinus TaxID=92743 RepID=A0A401W9N4_STREY|nr:hypothetical protein GKJPGBOP_05758 [Streptomyces paromomycinus]
MRLGTFVPTAAVIGDPAFVEPRTLIAGPEKGNREVSFR